MLWVLLSITAYMSVMGFVYFSHRVAPPTSKQKRRRRYDFDEPREYAPLQQRSTVQQTMINSSVSPNFRRDFLGTGDK